MEYDKTITIGVGNLTLDQVLSVTEVKISEEIDTDIVKTFDEPVSVPSSEGGYKVDIDVLEARKLDDFIKLKKIIQGLKTNQGRLAIYETIKHKTGSFKTEYHFSGVTLSDNELTYDAEDLTARSLSFNATSLREMVNGEEIKFDEAGNM